MALEEKQTHKYDVAAIENDEMSSCEIFSKFREPVYRSQFLHWMWFPCALLSLVSTPSIWSSSQIASTVFSATGSFKVCFVSHFTQVFSFIFHFFNPWICHWLLVFFNCYLAFARSKLVFSLFVLYTLVCHLTEHTKVGILLQEK